MAIYEPWRLLLEDEMKSTVEEIRQRFDADVERFSNLETGQSARCGCSIWSRVRSLRSGSSCASGTAST